MGVRPAVAVRQGRPHVAREQRVAVARGGGELRVILAGDEPGVIAKLDHLDQLTIQRAPSDAEPGAAQGVLVAVVELVAMAVALDDHLPSIELARQTLWRKPAGLATQAHAPAEVRGLATPLDGALSGSPFGDEAMTGCGVLPIEFRAVSAGKPRHMPRQLGSLRYLSPSPELGKRTVAGQV